MRRYLSAILASVSLTVCLFAAVMWVRSYFRTDSLTYLFDRQFTENGERRWANTIGTTPGSFFVRWEVTTYRRDPAILREFSNSGFLFDSRDANDPDRTTFLRRLGFGWAYEYAQFAGLNLQRTFGVVLIPWGLIATLTALWPIVWIRRILRHRRRIIAGHCPHCGYDLRATPDRCPECGGVAV